MHPLMCTGTVVAAIAVSIATPAIAAPGQAAGQARPAAGTPQANAQAEPPPLEDLARQVATELSGSSDTQVKSASCTLLGDTAGGACQGAPVDTQAQARSAIAALRQDVKAGEPEAVQRLTAVKDELMAKDPILAVEAIAALPGDAGQKELETLIGSDRPEVRREAAQAMSGKNLAEARDLVSRASKGQAPSDVGFGAALGLARQGDPDEVDRVTSWLPQLQGRDRLAAAGALAAAGRTEGTRALTEIAQSGRDDMLQLEAAAALVEARPDIAAQVVERGLASPNIWIRGEAAALATRLGPEWAGRVRDVLSTDGSPWVRLQAASGVLEK